MKDVSGCLSFVQPVTNVSTVAQDLPVQARLHQFLETWEALGAGPKVLKIFKGHTLPFRTMPNLTRSPIIISCCVNPLRSLYLTEHLTCTYYQKCKTGQKSEISGVFQPTILGPKAQQPVETNPRSQQSKPIPQG